MTKVSIIVPVYNVEPYLDKCLKSLVNQTLNDKEIIVVNDGTTDNCQKIIDKYTKKYPYIKSYIKENGGLSSARNYGIKLASGQYLAFVDSDDYVEKDMYKEMYELAMENDYDMVVCDLNYVYPSKIIRASSNVKTSTEDIQKNMLNIYPAVWNKIYKRSLVSNIYFKEGIWFEDVEYLYRVLPKIKNIGVIHKPFYQYLQREGSITKKRDLRIYNYIDNMNGLITYYKENNLYEKYYKELEYVYVRYIYATFIKQAVCFDKEEYKKAVDLAISNVSNNFLNYRKNKYFYQSIKGIYLLTFNKLYANIIWYLKHNN